MRADEVYRLAVAAGLDHEAAVTATAIAIPESGLNPTVQGDKSRVGEPTEDGRHWGVSTGLWQVRSIQEERGAGNERDELALRDPAHNAMAMAAISRGGTYWWPWSVWKDRSYLDHIDTVLEAIGAMAMSTVDIIRAVASDLEAAGVPVAFIDGWEDRGRPSAPALDPQGVVCHHTATHAYDHDYPSLGIVRDGRADLPGPLAQFGIGRHTGTVYVIASGKANHAGEGGWQGLSGNSTVWGIEAENDGIGEEWGTEIRRSYLLLVVALVRRTPFGAEMVCMHREWSPYKIDPTGIDGDEFRSQVSDVLATGELQEDDMAGFGEREADAVVFEAAFFEDVKNNFLKPLGDGDFGEGLRRLAAVFKGLYQSQAKK